MTYNLSESDVEPMLGMEKEEAVVYLIELGTEKELLSRIELDKLIGLTIPDAMEMLCDG